MHFLYKKIGFLKYYLSAVPHLNAMAFKITKRLPWTNCWDFSKGTFIFYRVCTLHRGLLNPIYLGKVSFPGYRVISLETDVALAISGLSSH